MSSLDPEYFEFDCECLALTLSPRHFPDRSSIDKELNKDELKKLLYDEVMSFQSLL